MRNTLLGVYRLARELSIPPQEILDWTESQFYLWLAVSRDSEKDDLMLRSIATSFAVWKPAELPKLFKNDGKKMNEDDVKKAVEKAEKVKGMKFKETT